MPRWMILISLVTPSLIIIGCGNPTMTVTLDEVKSAQIEFNSPTENPRPLQTNNSNDKVIIGKIVDWLNASQEVSGDTSPARQSIGPTELILVLKNGKLCKIEPARDCATTKLDNGTKIECRNADGQVIVNEGNKTDRVKAPGLDRWLLGKRQNDVR